MQLSDYKAVGSGEAGGGAIISICISKTHKRTRKVRKQFRFTSSLYGSNTGQIKDDH